MYDQISIVSDGVPGYKD